MYFSSYNYVNKVEIYILFHIQICTSCAVAHIVPQIKHALGEWLWCFHIYIYKYSKK